MHLDKFCRYANTNGLLTVFDPTSLRKEDWTRIFLVTDDGEPVDHVSTIKDVRVRLSEIFNINNITYEQCHGARYFVLAFHHNYTPMRERNSRMTVEDIGRLLGYTTCPKWWLD